MDAELLLELDLELEADRVGVPRLGDQAGELPEVGLLLARRRAERRGVHGADPLGEDAEAGLAEDLARVVADPSRGPRSARRTRGPRRRHRRARARGCGLPAGPPRPRSWWGCPPAGRSRRPRRRRCRRGGASSAASRAPAAPAHGWGWRPCGPRRRSRRRPCPRRSAAIRAGDRPARANSASSLVPPGSAPSSSGRATGLRTDGAAIIRRGHVATKVGESFTRLWCCSRGSVRSC